MTLVGGDAFSPVLVNDYLNEPEGAFGFSYPNRAYAGKNQGEEMDGYLKSAGSFTSDNNNDNTAPATFDLPLSPLVKQEPMTDPQQFLPFDAHTMGGTVNTADLFGSLPGSAAGAGMSVDMAPGMGMGMDMEKGFKGSFVFGNEDAGLGDYLGTLQQQIQLQQQLQFQQQQEQQQHSQQEQQQRQGNALPNQHSEDEGDSVNAASPAAHSVASTSSRKPSTTGSGTKASSAAAKASAPTTSKPAVKKSVGKKAVVAKQSRAVSVVASVRDYDEDDDEDDEEDDNKSRRGSEDMDTLPLPAMFGGVKGKGGKKGGGMSSVVLEDGEEAGEEDDWRPSVSFTTWTADFSVFTAWS